MKILPQKVNIMFYFLLKLCLNFCTNNFNLHNNDFVHANWMCTLYNVHCISIYPLMPWDPFISGTFLRVNFSFEFGFTVLPKIGSAVSEILRYRHTQILSLRYRQTESSLTFFYFIIRIYILFFSRRTMSNAIGEP